MLTGKQRRHLRALGHELKPIVQVGKDGIDDGLIAALDQALADHELVKIKIGEGAGLDRQEAADALASQTHSEVAQVLGNTVLLYRADPEDPQIKLPKPVRGEPPQGGPSAQGGLALAHSPRSLGLGPENDNAADDGGDDDVQ